MIEWHRLFGLVLKDFFTDSPFHVEVEMDLSTQQQRLDVIIIRKQPGVFLEPLPDGFGELVNHNLITFKSHKDALTAWSLQELVGHYVSYRNEESPDTDDLLPEGEFRLLAVCVRFPQQLAGQIELHEVSPGVYDCMCAMLPIRIVVVHRLPEVEQNALCHLFSANQTQVSFAAGRYSKRSPRTSSLVDELINHYRLEGTAMSYTWEDFERDRAKGLLERMPDDERSEYLRRFVLANPQAVLKVLSLEERLQGLTREEIENFLKKTNGDCVDAPPAE